MSGGLRIGESCARNSNGSTATSGASYRVVKSLPTKANRGASLAEIPTDTWSNFDATAEPKEAHMRKNEVLGRPSRTAEGSPVNSLRGEPCGHQ